ncbi:hypothetical protein EI545_13550 [Tabrizicola piscis]|uniref:Uncharacterized protein n=1 Tax=Tabrizicola piscis TaxID=2494374 RepID=A0A3S8U8C3_9RHOB|nr:hypothetical protein [Tabrizicola piscis]AZL59769.1 hypothetical protein EI545_13550 [Tabrizicola piscis]
MQSRETRHGFQAACAGLRPLGFAALGAGVQGGAGWQCLRCLWLPPAGVFGKEQVQDPRIPAVGAIWQDDS